MATIGAAIAPYAQARAQAREQIGAFVEIYVRCSIEELVRRDTKGLYAKALRAGQVPPPEFTRPEVAQVLIDAMRATG